MDARALERVRQKVEAGERLTDDELALLRAAAQGEAGPTLRLAVAHALVNNGDDRSALAILDRLVRDFPKDLQSWLGLARVHLSMERKEEAERALKQALALSPDDAEALKVMAVLAMERGEFARARQLVTGVLQRDPLDDEARLLKAELDAPSDPVPAPPPGVVVALRPEFSRALLRALRQKGVQGALRGDALFLRRPTGEWARADLKSLYGAYLAQQAPLEEAVRKLVEGLSAAAEGVPDQKDALLSRVLPVLRPGAFDQIARGAAHSAGPAGLSIFFVLDDPELVRYVPEGSLQARSLAVTEVSDAAFANLAQRTAPMRRVAIISGQLVAAGPTSRVWAVCAEDGHDGARLLTTTQRALIAREVGPGPWRVNLGLREVAVLCRAVDDEACAALESLPPAEDGIAGAFVLEAGGSLNRG